MRTIGIDFGLSVTDVVVVEDGQIVRARASAAGARAQAAAEVEAGAVRAAVAAAVATVGGTDDVVAVAATGGRSHLLAGSDGPGVPLIVVDEPRAVGTGALALSEVPRALVVSCGTGTAMVTAERSGACTHVTGTPVGGGTVVGLGRALLGADDAASVFDLARRGSAGAVDTTLADVVGTGVGSLPPSATAVSFGRLAAAAGHAAPEDLAAALVTMVAQTIGIIAVNAAAAHGAERVVLVGRLAGVDLVRGMIEAVFRVYGRPAPLVPAEGGQATALGAALAGSAAASADASDAARAS